MNVSFDLLAKDNLSTTADYSEGGFVSSVYKRNEFFTVACELTGESRYSLCGMQIHHSTQENVSNGLDLSDYHTLEVVIKLQSPVDITKIKLHFRNNHPAYSELDKDTGNKFNTIEFELKNELATLKIPTRAIFVSQWWKTEHNIGYQHSHVDMSNIVTTELVLDEATVDGNYIFTLQSLKMKGELISEPELLKLIVLLLFVTIVLLTLRQKNSLKIISTTDPLTGLLNRRGMTLKIDKEFKHIISNHSVSLFYFDVDDFKKINDTYGHVIGDELLAAICQKVIDILCELELKQNAAFARLAGDEFVLTIKDCDNEMAIELSHRIGQALSEPIGLSSCEVKVGVSLGFAHSNDERMSFQELLSRADSAMYCAKQQGKGQFKQFDDSVASAMYYKKTIAESLKDALLAEQFMLKFMPIFTCDTLKPERVEVLIRCNATSLQGVTPDIFIPIAEDFGLIKNIDLWVIEKTFATIKEHFLAKDIIPPIFCINISAMELMNEAFPRQLKKLIAKFDIEPTLIELEITETSLVEADDTSLLILNELKGLGVHLALDDFGTGYTAFNQLLSYPVDCLKIDRTFVADIDEKDLSQMTMVNAIVSIAKSYKLTTIGEGVETQEQLDYLLKISCDYAQGFFLSKPLSLEDLLALLEKSSITTEA